VHAPIGESELAAAHLLVQLQTAFPAASAPQTPPRPQAGAVGHVPAFSSSSAQGWHWH
jgi:hypothetical protein